jgi:hypothetical protein
MIRKLQSDLAIGDLTELVDRTDKKTPVNQTGAIVKPRSMKGNTVFKRF